MRLYRRAVHERHGRPGADSGRPAVSVQGPLSGGLPGRGRSALLHEGPYFHEFVTACTPETGEKILAALAQADILGGLPVEGGLLWCATELVSREELDKAADIVKEVLAQ